MVIIDTLSSVPTKRVLNLLTAIVGEICDSLVSTPIAVNSLLKSIHPDIRATASDHNPHAHQTTAKTPNIVDVISFLKIPTTIFVILVLALIKTIILDSFKSIGDTVNGLLELLLKILFVGHLFPFSLLDKYIIAYL